MASALVPGVTAVKTAVPRKREKGEFFLKGIFCEQILAG
jgi:hypothetical protein